MGEGALQRGREPIPREKILTAYRGGPEAIVSLIQYLQDLYEGDPRALRADYTVLAQQVKELQEKFHTDSTTAANLPPVMG